MSEKETKLKVTEVDGECCVELIFPLGSILLKPGESVTIRSTDAEGNHLGDETFTLVSSGEEPV